MKQHLIDTVLYYWIISAYSKLSCHFFPVSKFNGLLIYRNVPKFSDRQNWAKSVDPDQTAPGGPGAV